MELDAQELADATIAEYESEKTVIHLGENADLIVYSNNVLEIAGKHAWSYAAATISALRKSGYAFEVTGSSDCVILILSERSPQD